jgi:hypothetical protein
LERRLSDLDLSDSGRSAAGNVVVLDELVDLAVRG